MIRKLPASVNPLDEKILPAMEAENLEESISATHTIKGVTGNLSITPLYTAYTEIVNLLRSNKIPEAKKLYLETVPVQKEILEMIEKNS